MDPEDLGGVDTWVACPELGWNLCFDGAVSLTLHNAWWISWCPWAQDLESGRMTLRVDVLELHPVLERTTALMMTVANRNRLSLGEWGTSGGFSMEEEDVRVWNRVLDSINSHLHTAQSQLDRKQHLKAQVTQSEEHVSNLHDTWTATLPRLCSQRPVSQPRHSQLTNCPALGPCLQFCLTSSDQSQATPVRRTQTPFYIEHQANHQKAISQLGQRLWSRWEIMALTRNLGHKKQRIKKQTETKNRNTSPTNTNSEMRSSN